MLKVNCISINVITMEVAFVRHHRVNIHKARNSYRLRSMARVVNSLLAHGRGVILVTDKGYSISASDKL